MIEGQRYPKLRFGDFVVEPRARTLHRRHIRLKLHRQPFDALLLLLQRPSEVITRDEFTSKLWPNTFVDCEHGLNTTIKKLRQVIGDSAEHPRFIETVPRIGYRFIGTVETDLEPSKLEAAPAEPLTPAVSTAIFLRRLTRKRWLIAVVACALLIFVSIAFLWFRPHTVASSESSGAKIVLAVLPFENLTGDTSQNYLASGLTGEMIAQLGRQAPDNLGVIDLTSRVPYKTVQSQLAQIARPLGAEYILSGGVRRNTQAVRVTADLTRLRDHKVLWSRQYDRELTDLLALQTEIAQEIADEIQLTLQNRSRLSAAADKQHTSAIPYEAYDLYLKGRFSLSKRNQKGFLEAIQYFQQAVAKDPNYAAAYAGLADSYALTSSYNLAVPSELIPKARTAALTALKLDNNLAEAHTSLALIAENYDWDWQTAEQEFRKALQLDPNYPTAHQWYGEYLAWQGRFAEALAESERARQLDPLSIIIATDHAAISFYSRQYDRAIEELRTITEIEPTMGRAQGLLVGSYVEQGRFPDAFVQIEKWRRADNSLGVWAFQAYVYGRSGQIGKARQAFTKFEELTPHGGSDPLWVTSWVYAGMGDKEKFFSSLQTALNEHSNLITGLKVDPAYAPFHGDPRFQSLLKRVGLAQ